MQDVAFLATKGGAMFWLAFTEVYGWAPFLGLVFIGALDMINPDLFDAARIDGVSKFQLFYHVKLPLIMPVLVMVTLLKTIFSVKMIAISIALTRGGPGRATETINLFIYKRAFEFFEMGYASTISVILIVGMIIFAAIYIQVTKSKRTI
jgi:multiple sugar transport system permease protein